MFALDGVDVLTLENGVSAPLCTRMLGDLGAEVVKVERPGIGDVHRQWDSAVHGVSSAHVWLDRNKRSLELDLKAPEGREIFMELAEAADVVVQNFSPGVVDRLGVGYDDVRAVNEDVVYVNISGYGQEGTYRDRKAYDLVMQGETGLIMMNGHPDAPAKIPISICDVNAAMYGTLSALTALYHRERTGEGQMANVDMFTGILSWLGVFPLKYWYQDERPGRVGMRHHILTPYGPHETAEGEYVNFAVLSDAHWRSFCADVVERPELASDPRFKTNAARVENREALEPLVEEIIASEPRKHWVERLQSSGLPWGDVNHIDDVLDHPRTVESGLVRSMETDVGDVRYIDNPLDLGGLDLRRDPFPGLGEHTAEILDEMGYSAGDVERLREDGVI